MRTTKRTSSRVQSPHGDRFDAVARSSRVGAHRAVERPGSTGAWLLISTLATLILIALGILIYTLQPGSVSFFGKETDSSSSAVSKVSAEISPETTVVVLNGTTEEDLGFVVGEAIDAEGWGSTLFASDAEESDIQISAIFYSDPSDEGFAKGLGEQLGGISYYLNPNYMTHGNQLTVLLGADYRGPGADQPE